MNEELDKILKDLNGNITQFKEMVDRYRQVEERLNDTASGLNDLRKELEVIREQTAPAGLEHVEQEQQRLQEYLQRLERDVQTVKATTKSDQEQRASQYQALKDEVSRLGPRQGKIQEDIARLEQHRHDTESLLQHLADQMNKAVIAQRRWIFALALSVGVLLFFVVGLAVYSLSGHTTAAAEKSAGDKPAKAEMPASDPAPSPDTLSQAPPPPTAGEQDLAVPALSPESRAPGLMPAKSAEKLIKDRSGFALTYLKHANFARLAAKYIHPEKGVRFFPMGLGVSGKSFSAQVLPDAMRAPALYTWTDATGQHAVEATFSDYYKKYVYDQDFLSATQIRFNSIAFPGKHGLSAAGIANQFPGCIFVEYQKNGKSLVLVFERYDGPGAWYLVGVVHGE